MTIAVAYSDSPEGRAAIVHAAREALARREPLLVLHVLDDESGPDVESDLTALRAAVQAILDSGGLGESPWELQTTGHDGDRVGALVRLVEKSGVGLLVAGTRRKSPVGKFLLERTLQRLLLEVPVPVLVVKDDAY